MNDSDERRVEYSDRYVTIFSLYPRPGFRVCFTDLDLEDLEVGGWRKAVQHGLAARQVAWESYTTTPRRKTISERPKPTPDSRPPRRVGDWMIECDAGAGRRDTRRTDGGGGLHRPGPPAQKRAHQRARPAPVPGGPGGPAARPCPVGLPRRLPPRADLFFGVKEAGTRTAAARSRTIRRGRVSGGSSGQARRTRSPRANALSSTWS